MESTPKPEETGIDRRTALGVLAGSTVLTAGIISLCKAMDIPNNHMAESVFDENDIKENKLIQRILQQ